MVFSQLLWFILNKMPEFSLIECVSTSVVLVLKMFTHITTIISFMKASVDVKSTKQIYLLIFFTDYIVHNSISGVLLSW